MLAFVSLVDSFPQSFGDSKSSANQLTGFYMMETLVVKSLPFASWCVPWKFIDTLCFSIWWSFGSIIRWTVLRTNALWNSQYYKHIMVTNIVEKGLFWISTFHGPPSPSWTQHKTFKRCLERLMYFQLRYMPGSSP